MATTQKGKKTNTKKKSTAKKNTKSSAKSKSSKAARAASNGQNRQVGAIVLFAVAVFLLFVLIIPGSNVWAFLRGLVYGLFGICAYIWPVILIYVAVMTSLDRDKIDLRTKIIEASIIIVLLCSAIHIFTYDDVVNNYSFGQAIVEAYEDSTTAHNGGAIGAFFGGILLLLFGSKVPAAITIIILLFVMVLVISGTTLTNFFQGLVDPVKKAGSATSEHFEERAQNKEERRQRRVDQQRYKELDLKHERQRFNPDVDLGPEFDEKPQKTRKTTKKAEGTPAPVDEPKAEVRLDDIVKKAAKKQEPEAAAVAPAARTNAAKQKDETPAEVTLSDKPEGEAEEPKYELPPLDCLRKPNPSASGNSEAELKNNAEKLVNVLDSFGVKTTLVDIARGPAVTRYELKPAVGVKISKITNLADDIALNLAAGNIRIEAPIPNKAAVGIEVPNQTREAVTLREVLESPTYKRNLQKSKLTVALGRDIAGNICTTDISKLPHLLIAGTTGSGKSVCLNTMILSILYNATPDEVKLVMIDPKKVEFSVYNGIPHLLVPVVAEPKKAAGALAWAVKEMLNRYKMFSENNVRDIRGYNELAKMDPDKKTMPEIVIFIDELADLMMATPTEVEDSICRLAQMARAAGMHLVIATQRPSVDVITGLIKANIPSRLSLSVASAVDSRTILDMAGAEKLLGNGDMLFNPVGNSKPVRIQGCFESDKEVEDVCKFLKEQVKTEYNEEILKEIEKEAAAAEAADGKKGGGAPVGGASGDDDADALLTDAIQVVIEAGQASATLIQRKLKVGYARAGRIIDELEERGVIGPYEGSKPRKVLMTKNQWLEMNAMSGDEDDGTAAAIDLGIDDEPLD